jgi:hypothetical protein
VEVLQAAEPALPVEDREADVWEPLIAVADLAGGDWPDRARDACLAFHLAASGSAEEQSLSTKLLVDLRDICGGVDRSAVASSWLVDQLRALPESPWDHFDFTQRQLAHRLSPYGVKSERVRPDGGDGKQVRGYRLADLADVFERYIPADASGGDVSQRVTASQIPSEASAARDPRVTDEDPVTERSVTEESSVTGTTVVPEGPAPICDAVTVRDAPPPRTGGVTAADLRNAWHEDRTGALSEDAALERLEAEFAATIEGDA